jgi:hypothetical protein
MDSIEIVHLDFLTILRKLSKSIMDIYFTKMVGCLHYLRMVKAHQLFSLLVQDSHHKQVLHAKPPQPLATTVK